MKQFFLKFLFLSIVCITTTSIYGQDLTNDTAFFQKAGKEYQAFLENTTLDNILYLDTVQTFPDKVILNMVMTSYNDWASLSSQYKKDFEVDIRQTLFNKAAFLFEVDEDSLGIRIWSSDFTLVEVQLLYSNDELKIIENKERAIRLDSLVLDKRRFPKIAKKDTYQTITFCKDKIEKKLVKYYKKEHKGVKIEPNTRRPKEMKLKVRNIRGEVLHDHWFPYWEYIVIKINFKERSGKLIIYYEVEAKYGSGVFRGPRLSDYTDMDTEYKAYVNDYMEKLDEIIYKAIK
ncbi:MAG: hypothetical protein AB8G11_25930 [Saprospiraceae bacterium]